MDTDEELKEKRSDLYYNPAIPQLLVFVTILSNRKGAKIAGQVVDGRAKIEVPDHFRMVTAAEGLTVQLTSVGQPAVLYCITTSLETIEVGGTADVAFNFQVNGVRKAFADAMGIAP